MSLTLIVLSSAVFLAWRNYSRGRGDLQGASRLAAFAFGLGLIERGFTVHFVFPEVLAKLIPALANALLFGGVLWVLYLGVEPYVRRRWPQRLISWTRVLGGHWRDPVVGGHILVGTAAGVGLSVMGEVITIFDQGSRAFINPHLYSLRGSGAAVAGLVDTMGQSIATPLIIFALYSLLQVVFRREWIAGVAIVAVLAAVGFLGRGPSTGVAVVVGVVVFIWIIRRFGVLPLVLAVFVSNIFSFAPMTFEFTAWYSYITVMALLILIGLCAWSFYVALGGRQLIRENLLDA